MPESHAASDESAVTQMRNQSVGGYRSTRFANTRDDKPSPNISTSQPQSERDTSAMIRTSPQQSAHDASSSGQSRAIWRTASNQLVNAACSRQHALDAAKELLAGKHPGSSRASIAHTAPRRRPGEAGGGVEFCGAARIEPGVKPSVASVASRVTLRVAEKPFLFFSVRCVLRLRSGTFLELVSRNESFPHERKLSNCSWLPRSRTGLICNFGTLMQAHRKGCVPALSARWKRQPVFAFPKSELGSPAARPRHTAMK